MADVWSDTWADFWGGPEDEVWQLPTPPELVVYSSRVVLLGGPKDGAVLPVTAGRVTVDQGSDVRRTGDLTVAGLAEWAPDDGMDVLDPRSGVELRVEQHGPGGWVSQGIFSVSRPRVSKAADGIRISAEITDRSDRVRLAGMDRRWVVSAGMPVSDAIRGVLTQVAPWIPSDFPDTPETVAADVLLEFGDDPWRACLDLAQSVGLDLYADPLGIVRTAPATAALSATPVQVTWLSVDREIDTAQIINHVRAEWSPARPDPVPKGFDDKGGFEDAVDDTSSTSVLSWVGRRVKLVKGDRSLLTSASAARQAAQIELLRGLDATYSGRGAVAPDTALDVGQVVVLDGDRFRINRLEIDLARGATSVTLGTPPVPMSALLARALQVPGDRRTREVVTSVSPLMTALASDPTGSQVSVTPTAAVTGVTVGDMVEVLHRGKGERIAIARFIGGASPYALAVMADNPLCYFPLDDTATAVDAMRNVTPKSMTGVTFGGVSLGDGVTSATVSGAAGAGIVLPKESFTGVRNFTVEILAKASNMAAQRYMTGMDGSGVVFGFLLRHTAAAQIQADTGATWPNTIGTAVTEATPTSTHHYAITYDGTDAKLYRDGAVIASEAQTWSATDPTSDMWIGGRSATTTGFLGIVAGFAFHKEALPASRLLAHAKAAGLA